MKYHRLNNTWVGALSKLFGALRGEPLINLRILFFNDKVAGVLKLSRWISPLWFISKLRILIGSLRCLCLLLLVSDHFVLVLEHSIESCSFDWMLGWTSPDLKVMLIWTIHINNGWVSKVPLLFSPSPSPSPVIPSPSLRKAWYPG